jgi:zinc-ribbon domain
MAKFCMQCGAALPDVARFCAGCGASVADTDADGFAAAETLSEPQEVAPQQVVDTPEERSGPNWLLIGGAAAVLLLFALYYAVFLHDDVGGQAAPPTPAKVVSKEVVETELFAVADANIREKATTVETAILGKLLRGQPVTGERILGEDGVTEWLKLAENKGFIATSNLSEKMPPAITKPLGDKIWSTDKAITIYAEPSTTSGQIDSVKIGTPLTLYGLTANDFIEIKLRKGGVGYIAGGARIVALTLVKGKPIAIAFNPDSCNFGGELEAEFGKLTAKSRAAYKAIDMTDFASDAARDKALIGFEGKSYFQRLERSFNGLSITGIAQHYESQSLYFADAPDKVLAAFKAAGYKIGRDGQFANTEIYAGIGATAGEGRGFGRSDLSCGV